MFNDFVPLLNQYFPALWELADENDPSHVHVMALFLELKLFLFVLVFHNQGLKHVRVEVDTSFMLGSGHAVFTLWKFLLTLHDVFKNEFKRVGLLPSDGS